MKSSRLGAAYIILFALLSACVSPKVDVKNQEIFKAKGEVIIGAPEPRDDRRLLTGYRDPILDFGTVESYLRYIEGEYKDSSYVNKDITDIYGNTFYGDDQGKLTWLSQGPILDFSMERDDKVKVKSGQNLSDLTRGASANLLTMLGEEITELPNRKTYSKFFDFSEAKEEEMFTESYNKEFGKHTFIFSGGVYDETEDIYQCMYTSLEAGYPVFMLKIMNSQSPSSGLFVVKEITQLLGDPGEDESLSHLSEEDIIESEPVNAS